MISHTGFKTRHEYLIDTGELTSDATQQPLIEEFERLALALSHYPPRFNFGQWLPFMEVKTPPKGVYIWGDVGRGKTHLMNLFYEFLPCTDKWRIHFHRFMQWVHEQNGKHAHERDPLKLIAQRIRSKNRIVCLDEFMVTDIADAMILSSLLKHFFNAGIILVTTSNRPPDELYFDGLQRDHFLPAIAQIKQHTNSVEVNGEKDYRKQAWICDEIYYSPLGDKAEDGLRFCYQQLTEVPGLNPQSITIAGRPIKTKSVQGDVIWLEFDEICKTHRSQHDYIQLSNQFKTIIVSNIPELTREDDDAARRLINLIDTAYDYDVNLLVSAALPPEQIYTGNQLKKPFRRTASRLWEMSTKKYLLGEKGIK